MNKIAVIIPCYNGERFLATAIESIRAQTQKVCEIVVVDDCSTDGSVALATRLGARVMQTPRNSGAASTRNLGLRSTDAPLLAFLDCDDAWLRHHVESLLPAFENPETQLAFSRTHPMEAPPVVPLGNLRPPTHMFLPLLRENLVTQSTVIARREVLLAAGGYKDGERYAEDYSLWLRMSLKGLMAEYDAPTCLRRSHENQLSNHNAAFIGKAFQARREAVALFKDCRSRCATQHEIDDAVSAALDAELLTARYIGDWDSVEEALSATSEFEVLNQRASELREWHRRRWPLYWMLSKARRALGRA